MGINVRKGKAEDGGFILKGDIHVTQRELEALAAIAEGHDNENGANKLGIRYTTFRNHTYNIMKKLGAKNRTEALVKAVENGMIVISPKRKLDNKSEKERLICKFCERAFTWDEAIKKYEDPFFVNHVLVEPPDWKKCPYNDCNGLALESYKWESVKKFYPEYPEIPEKGAKYPITKLFDNERQAFEEFERKWLNGEISI